MQTMKTLILTMLLVALMVSLCVPARAGGIFVRQGAGNGTPVIYAEEPYKATPQETETQSQVAQIVEKKTLKPWIFACGMLLAAGLAAGLVAYLQTRKIKKT